MWQIDIVQGDENATEVTTLETLTGELQSALSSINSAQHAYQYEFTNSVDVFAGYFTVNRSTFQYGGPLPFTYSWPNDRPSTMHIRRQTISASPSTRPSLR